VSTGRSKLGYFACASEAGINRSIIAQGAKNRLLKRNATLLMQMHDPKVTFEPLIQVTWSTDRLVREIGQLQLRNVVKRFKDVMVYKEGPA
jgi:hypothetical protein